MIPERCAWCKELVDPPVAIVVMRNGEWVHARCVDDMAAFHKAVFLP